ncbi:MAG: S41 family peptidase [Desulfomicrobium sp.]|nr:S41 family peptidase [Desulfomicrobium sp.]MDP3429892.1 S41 family peptidase [Desulfomicrobium sp.]
MRIAVLWMVAVMMALPVPAGAQSAPLEEIRGILRTRALLAPPESVLGALTETGLQDALAGVDPYARYFASGQYVSPAAGHDSRVGIGADLVPRGKELFLAVYQGGAAASAGLPDRSRLVAVDGRDVLGLDPEAVARLLRGDEGTVVRIAIVSPVGVASTVVVRREPFRPLDVETVPPHNAVVRIREFVGGLTRPALLATLDFLARTSAGRAGADREPLIIDLRDATGGDLYEAFDTAALFVPIGTLLGTLRGPGGESRPVRAPAGQKFDMPLALIVGPDTASAAEIFAGALQDNGRAKLLGQRTFGKCSSQTDVRLSDGSVLRFTNREILLPGGDSCSGTGLSPDRMMDGEASADLASAVATVRKMFTVD